jgi:hypothetical protein
MKPKSRFSTAIVWIGGAMMFLGLSVLVPAALTMIQPCPMSLSVHPPVPPHCLSSFPLSGEATSGEPRLFSVALDPSMIWGLGLVVGGMVVCSLGMDRSHAADHGGETA